MLVYPDNTFKSNRSPLYVTMRSNFFNSSTRLVTSSSYQARY